MTKCNCLSSRIDPLLGVAAALVTAWAMHIVFMVAPDERTMGAVQRIFYFHLGSAAACAASIGVLFIAGIFFLAGRSQKAAAAMTAGGEVAFVFCTIVLVTGMIWGKSAWNTWFHWEPRLVSFLILWLMLLSFNLLPLFGDPQKKDAHSAVLAIVITLTVPLVVFSINMLPQSQQLHPKVVGGGGLRSPAYVLALEVSTIGLLLFNTWLLRLRYRIELISRRLVRL